MDFSFFYSKHSIVSVLNESVEKEDRHMAEKEAILSDCKNRCRSTLAIIRSMESELKEFKSNREQERQKLLHLRQRITTENIQMVKHLKKTNIGVRS